MSTTTRDDRPVLVVGAGPTGMTAAVELSRAGVRVRIVDMATEPSTTSRALAVQARTLELLEPRGIAEQMVRLGNPARSTTLYQRGQRLGGVDLGRVPSRYDYVLMLSQAETERLLGEQLAHQGVAVERGVQMITFTQLPSSASGAGGVRVVLRHPGGHLEEVLASYLIGAEGAHSSVRHVLGLPFTGRALRQRFALADLHLDADLPDDEMSIFPEAHGFLAVFPMGDRRFRLMATDPTHQAQDAADAADPTLGELQGAWDHLTAIPGHLRDMNWSSRFAINSRHLATLRVGSVFLGGDAAHVHSPVGGQGMNTGIQDMINLSWKLAAVLGGRADPALLDTYTDERLPVISSLVRTTEATTNALNSDNRLVHQLLIRTLALALGVQAVQDKGTGVLSQVHVSYRKSPLSASTGRRAALLGHLHTGDRIPDLDVMVLPDVQPDVQDSSHQPHRARLHQLLDPSGLTLLVAEPRPSATSPASPATSPAAWQEQLAPWRDVVTTRRALAEADQPARPAADADLAHALAERGGLLLVRPDGYLGAAAAHQDPGALLTWLRRWFIPARSTAPTRELSPPGWCTARPLGSAS